jgi:hypothetical protein
MKRPGLVLCCAALLAALGCRAPHERIDHGMTGAQVQALMGRPEWSDAWTLEDGRSMRAMIYPVERRRPGRSLVTTTSFPVVLVDGRVIGWGDAVRYLGGLESLQATR